MSAPLRLILLSALSAAAACGPPRPTSVLPQGPLGDTDPVAAIIERTPVLQLADSQVAALRMIKRELDRVNRPLREQLEQMGLLRPLEPMRRPPDPPTEEQKERAKPLIEEMRENNRRAREAALELLTSVQRTRLDSLEQAYRERRGSRRSG
jgi:hypothetical protein